MPSPDETAPRGVATRVVDCLRDSAARIRVVDVRIGLGYMAVKLEDGRTGVAFTFRDLARGGCSVFHGLRPLSEKPALDLLPLLSSEDVVEAGVGLACANALANRQDTPCAIGDVLDHLALGPEDDVGMVGHFGPLVGPIQTRVRSLTVFERVQLPVGQLRPQEEAAAALPHCQVAIITATSIINRSVDELLAAARDCREVVLLGASTPLVPEAFPAGVVTMLSGVVVQNPGEVLRVVSEGGGMQQFGPHVRKVTVRVRPPRPGAVGSQNNNSRVTP